MIEPYTIIGTLYGHQFTSGDELYAGSEIFQPVLISDI